MNIILIGMPGAGKSTLGVLLAKALGMNFIDTDIVIQQIEGRLLQDIIDNDGIEKFMEIEGNIVSGLILKNSVIATGGSIIFSEKAIKTLRQEGRLYYLHVPYEEIKKRLKNIKTRGIVIKKGYSLEDVYKERIPLYQKYADKTIDCSNKNIEECVSEIIEQIQYNNTVNINKQALD